MGNHEFCEDCHENDFHFGRPCNPVKLAKVQFENDRRLMKPKDFEDACETAIGDWLWDESLSRDHTVKVSLSVFEIRLIANILRSNHGKKVLIPMENTESNREKYAL